VITHVGKPDKEVRRVPGVGIFIEELHKMLPDMTFVDYDFRNQQMSMQNIEKAIDMSDITV
jgi:hypothetical protein